MSLNSAVILYIFVLHWPHTTSKNINSFLSNTTWRGILSYLLYTSKLNYIFSSQSCFITMLAYKAPSLFISTLLVLLCCIFHNVIAVGVSLESYPDGTYAFGTIVAGGETPSRDTMRKNVKEAYESMGRNSAGVEPGDTMAALYVSGKGTIYHSSIRGARGSDATRDLVNSCTQNGHRYYGNCAEMGALALAKKNGWTLKGAYWAVYGVKDKRTGAVDYLSPCADQGGYEGCATIIENEDMICLTKRGGKTACTSKKTSSSSTRKHARQNLLSEKRWEVVDDLA